ncbi:unnamed protein product [Toxocara canis]|uniref:LITAF domain-containing protein n=1 Tax=Toxocara canis TaxID=6265 RepID=A0A183U8P9_TOXCA|nr:unnamed protein product [Toxocara canis]
MSVFVAPTAAASGPNIVVNTNAVGGGGGGGGGGTSGGACHMTAVACPICKIGVIVIRR